MSGKIVGCNSKGIFSSVFMHTRGVQNVNAEPCGLFLIVKLLYGTSGIVARGKWYLSMLLSLMFAHRVLCASTKVTVTAMKPV